MRKTVWFDNRNQMSECESVKHADNFEAQGAALMIGPVNTQGQRMGGAEGV